jgi:NhaP-type Na+/H+ or K+/H+ antiporter
MPDVVILWFLFAGGLLISLALAGSVVRRLPLTTSLLYLVAGVILGPAGLGLLRIDLLAHAPLVERLTEIAVLISLFTAGLKLRLPFRDERWWPPLRLATLTMVMTIALVAAVGVAWLDLPLGAAVLLGAVLAPTDPVLASDVQVAHAGDRDRLRFSLTGEAGLNDGTAFPFVMLGLGLLGLHELGDFGWRWLAIDLVWASLGGLAIGWLLGRLLGRLVLYLRRAHHEALGLDDFLALGLIALAYGVALLLHTYGFLAVFAAGLALRQIEREANGDHPPTEPVDSVGAPARAESATDPRRAPAYLAQAVLAFNQQAERIGEVAIVVAVGALLLVRGLPGEALWFVPLLLLVIRPLAVGLGLLGAPIAPLRRGLIAWFGLRGIGSLYYLSFAISHGLPEELAGRLTPLTMAVVAASVIVHGISVTPLMDWYERATSTEYRVPSTEE